MKFLLVGINAKFIHTNPAVRSLKAYAGPEYAEHIEIAEYTINQYTRDILADIYRKSPDVIGFSCYIWNFDIVKLLLKELKKVLPDTDIWLGGPEVSYHGEETIKKFGELTGIMVGEGEETFKSLIKWYADGGDENALKSIRGLQLPGGFTGVAKPVDMDTIPFFYNDMSEYKDRIIYYESSRGCPYSCSYCLSSVEKTLRFRSLDLVKSELQFFLDKKVKQVKFIDRTFNCDHDRTMEIWRYIHEHDNGVTNFHFEIAADILKEDELDLLKEFRPGLAQLEIGVQSTNLMTIDAINRRMDIDKLRTIVESVKAGRNVHEHLDLIVGLPYEDYASFKKSFNDVYSMEPEQLQMGFLKVLKGAKMEADAEKYGICYSDEPPYEVLFTNWLNFGEVLRLKQVEEMVELYYNSNQFTHILPAMVKIFESPFDMFEELAKFYEKNGYFVASPARSYRYNVLLNFLRDKDPENMDFYRDLALYDMYLRENLKSRPDFAGELSDDEKMRIKAFFEAEEKERKYLPSYIGFDKKQLRRNAHLEFFDFDVNSVVPAKKETAILFDYSERNPLNMEARTCVIR
ncbi:MAG: B12-binding domain-containing radical SAM protein [Lachnospiraceae bacterium]|nr:B12-binding domain-containing radical SAM protein [Lachnospiraceae bacterium]